MTYLKNGWSDWCETKKGGASVGYRVNNVALTFDLTHDLDLWFFKVKFQNNCISEIVIWYVKQKESKSIRYWADCMVLAFDHTHDIDLVVSRSKFEKALIILIIHDHDLWVTILGWVDVPYTDLGDFRRRRAIDMSSSYRHCHSAITLQ